MRIPWAPLLCSAPAPDVYTPRLRRMDVGAAGGRPASTVARRAQAPPPAVKPYEKSATVSV